MELRDFSALLHTHCHNTQLLQNKLQSLHATATMTTGAVCMPLLLRLWLITCMFAG